MAVQCRTSALHCHQLLCFLVVPSTEPLTRHRPLCCHFHCCHIASFTPVSFGPSPYDAAVSGMSTACILIKIPRPQALISPFSTPPPPLLVFSPIHQILRPSIICPIQFSVTLAVAEFTVPHEVFPFYNPSQPQMIPKSGVGHRIPESPQSVLIKLAIDDGPWSR